MELIKKDSTWFLSAEGGKRFAEISSLEDRTLFIYSYLKTIVNEKFKRDEVLFKLALFTADAIYNSDFAYAKYPEILKLDCNPFFAYLSNVTAYWGNEKTYVILSSILHNKANAFNKSEWIYDKHLLNSDDFLKELSERDIEFLPVNASSMVDPEAYNIESGLALPQLELVWSFLK